MMNIIKMLVIAIAGIVLLIYPVASLFTIILIIGIALIAYGLFSCLAFFMGRGKDVPDEKKTGILSIIVGIIALACGIFVIVKPNMVADLFPTLVGLLVLAAGLLSGVDAVARRSESPSWKSTLAISIATFILGAIIMVRNFDQGTTVRMLGTVMLYLGAAGIMDNNKVEEQATPSN